MTISEKTNIHQTPVWYPLLANYSFPTSFVQLHPEELDTLAKGRKSGDIVDDIIKRLSDPMKYFPGNSFVFCDVAAPTDTIRFHKKRGAVYSARSAWRFLAESEKITTLAKENKIKTICIRPFRRMNKAREFRLFIYGKELKAMSQYWLIRHFKRLEILKGTYWDMAKQFVKEISWLLPIDNVVIDIYFTSDNKILLIDLNPWKECSPLLLKDWNIDWETTKPGIQIINPPTTISGDISVSF